MALDVDDSSRKFGRFVQRLPIYAQSALGIASVAPANHL